MPASAVALKGAFVRTSTGSTSSPPEIFVFQYNPESMTRRLVARAGREPEERISFTLLLDATDALEDPDNARETARHGVAPDLAQLKSMLETPRPADASTGNAFLDALRRLFGGGSSPAVAKEQTLFVWGADSVVPIRIRSLKVTEELFDTQLHPLRARVAVELQARSPEHVAAHPQLDAAVARLRR